MATADESGYKAQNTGFGGSRQNKNALSIGK
jgi:hypothetical protein